MKCEVRLMKMIEMKVEGSVRESEVGSKADDGGDRGKKMEGSERL